MKQTIKNLTLTAMFLALGLILPFFTGQIPQIGNMLLPMHIPVLMCGFICGWQYGGTIGFILPLLRFMLFGMPPIYPIGIAMAFELATYGVLSGILFSHSRWKCIVSLYRCLIIAMIGGRIVWGIVRMVISAAGGVMFSWKLFMAGAFFNAIPGIIVQLVLIPTVMLALEKTGIVRFHRHKKAMVKIHSK